MFKIICAGWNCARFVTDTLESIDMQGRRDFEVMITYEGDANDPGFDIISDWINSKNRMSFATRWEKQGHYHSVFRVGQENFLYGTKARYDAIQMLNPNDEDVIIWLNIDGDRFAHWRVLDRVWDAYADGFPLLTYGNFETVPRIAAPLFALPYDNAIIANRSFRSAPFRAADLRTMKYKVFKEIPIDQFQWNSYSSIGNGWYTKIDDMTSMIPALELVGIRHRYIEEVLMHYNTLNPYSGTQIAPEETHACDVDFRSKQPLAEQVFERTPCSKSSPVAGTASPGSSRRWPLLPDRQ